MAIDPNTTDTVTIPQLDPLILALESFLVGANADGKMGNFTAQQLAEFIAPYVSAIGSSPFVANTGSPLPNPIEKPTAITFVGAGDFDQTTGANVVTTEALNVLFWSSVDGVTGTWVIGVAVSIDLSGYLQAETTSSPVFEIADDLDNIAFRVEANGRIAATHITNQTAIRWREDLGIGEDPKKIDGAVLNFIGNSISTNTGGAGLNEAQIYHSLMRDINGCTVYVNAIGGTMIADNISASIPFVDASRWGTMNTNNPFAVFIEGGVNDFLRNLNIMGTADDAPDNSTTASFYASLKYLYSSILNLVPNARLFHILPMHTTSIPALPGSSVGFNGTYYLYEYVEAIKDMCFRYGVGVIDMYQESGITDYNIDLMSSDGLHPDASGQEIIYRTIINKLETVL